MYFVKTRYKIYEWSKPATVLSVFGGILKAFFWICICSIGILLFMIPTAENPNYIDDIKVFIPVVFVIGIAFAIIGGWIQKKAEELSAVHFTNKVKNDISFTKKMAKKNPQQKEWYISQNPEYAEYVLSGAAELDMDKEDENEVKKLSPVRLLLAFILACVFIFGGMYLLDSFN